MFSNNRITAIKSLNSCTAPFPSASGVLRRYRNRLIIIIVLLLLLLSLLLLLFTKEDRLQPPWESSMETHNHTGYTSSGGVQHGNTHSHKRICKLCGGPALTQLDIQPPWESSMETHNHTGYTSDRGSPAWKHTFTQEDIQALWKRIYT